MSKRLWMVALLTALLVLSGCTPNAQNQAATPEPPSLPVDVVSQAPPMALPTQAPLPEGYDPSAEEDTDAEPVVGFTASPGQVATQVPSTQFAGATPITLNPIDVTNPPKQTLAFTYTPYAATKLGIQFEGPAGWLVDDLATDTYTLSQPTEQIVDNYQAAFTFQFTTVTSAYTAANIRQDLAAKLADMGRINYQSWSPSSATERSLLNAPGYYANYRGVMTDGTIVRGRIHMSLLPGNRLLMLHMTCPAEYNSDYTAVFSHIRNTLKSL